MQVLKKQIQKTQTRQRILDAAYRVFSQSGYFGSTALIAQEAGVAHGSVFVHFPTFNNLLVCLFEDFFHKAGLRLHDATHSAAEKGKGLEHMLSVHLDVLEEHENCYTYLTSDMDMLPPDVRTMFLGFQSAVSVYFYGMIKRERKEKAIKSIDQHLLFNTWIGLVHYYLQNKEFFAPNESVIKRYRQELISTFLKLISSGSK